MKTFEQYKYYFLRDFLDGNGEDYLTDVENTEDLNDFKKYCNKQVDNVIKEITSYLEDKEQDDSFSYDYCAVYIIHIAATLLRAMADVDDIVNSRKIEKKVKALSDKVDEVLNDSNR